MAKSYGSVMRVGNAVKLGLKIAAVCFAFGVCFAMGGALAGVARLVPQVAAQTAQPNFFLPFAVFCLSVGSVVSYLILRSSWSGWQLAAALFAATYGISTIAAQLDSLFFLSGKLPAGMIRALFEQGAIAMALFTLLALSLLGKWKPTPMPIGNAGAPLTAAALSWRIASLVVAFVFLYFVFGYYVAWQNPALRAYYGGTDAVSFYESLKTNWRQQPLLFLLQACRALLYVACVYPLLRMLRVARWEKAVAAALFLASWTTALLLPNPLMPATVARSHFWETLGFNLTFGVLMGCLLERAAPGVARLSSEIGSKWPMNRANQKSGP